MFSNCGLLANVDLTVDDNAQFLTYNWSNGTADEDLFFVTTGFFYCGILMVHGWRLDPILLFSQALIITSVLLAGWENIRLRGLIFKMRKKKEK